VISACAINCQSVLYIMAAKHSARACQATKLHTVMVTKLHVANIPSAKK
jgi:hypothetical protein